MFVFVFRFDDLRFRLQQNIDFLGQGGDRLRHLGHPLGGQAGDAGVERLQARGQLRQLLAAGQVEGDAELLQRPGDARAGRALDRGGEVGDALCKCGGVH